MTSSRHRSSRNTRGSPRRGRILVFLIGIVTVLVVAVALPLMLSGNPITQGLTPTGTTVAGGTIAPGSTQGLPLNDLPSLIPVGQASLPPDPSQPDPSLSIDNGPGIVANRIRIPSLSIDLKIVEGDGLDVPLFKAAHYPSSAWPGGGTNIYLYAHARTGMFITLWDARVGDQVFLDLKDGTTRTYIVDDIQRNVPWNQLSLLNPTPTEQLTLQTCVSYGETAPRFVVIAHPAT